MYMYIYIYWLDIYFRKDFTKILVLNEIHKISEILQITSKDPQS